MVSSTKLAVSSSSDSLSLALRLLTPSTVVVADSSVARCTMLRSPIGHSSGGVRGQTYPFRTRAGGAAGSKFMSGVRWQTEKLKVVGQSSSITKLMKHRQESTVAIDCFPFTSAGL